MVRFVRAVALAALLLGGTARASDPWEFWPELDLYETLGPASRLYFVAAYATGKDSELKTLDLAAYFDFTLEPFLRASLHEKDWRHDKYLWARIGYDHVIRAAGGATVAPEERGIVSILARAYLPAEVVLEGRARVDLRWIGGDYSTRYRLRGELNREFSLNGHAITPYFQAEAFYDTRSDAWTRQLYQAGAEIELTRHFRIEPSLARQVDRGQETVGLNAFAFVARWYY